MNREKGILPPYDLHLHTWLSPCGAREESMSAPRVYAEEARRRGLETIGITDHFALPLPWVHEWYANSGPQIIVEARRLASETDGGVRVLVGCEADLVEPGKVTIDAAFAREVDYVMLAASHFDDKSVQEKARQDGALAAEYLVGYLEEAVALPFADIIAHPLAVPEQRMGEPEAYMPFVRDEDIRRISAAAARAGIAFELNGRIASIESYRRTMGRFFLIAKDEGVRFTVGSDAHSVKATSRLDGALLFARELGLDEGDFATVDEILARHDQARG